MSFAHLALRLSVNEALSPAASAAAQAAYEAALVAAGYYEDWKNQAAHWFIVKQTLPADFPKPAGFPTIAGKRVYDSRIDMIAGDDDLSSIESNAVIVVYTEDHHTEPYGAARYPAQENIVTLVLELMLAVRGEITVDLPDGTTRTEGAPDVPLTDRQHEALLDTLEAQVLWILNPKNMAPTAGLYRALAWEIRSVHSDPQRAADRAVRIAARTVKIHIKIQPEVWPPFPISPAPTGLDRLPEPLRSVAYGLPAGSSAAALCAQLADFAPQPANPVPLDGINISAPLNGGAETDGFIPTL